ncbi:histidine phosphatase family protein [Saccharopolyspora sp. ASAGF58]|uniref:histidine phosphatase family protein n=1 Tax=Saccharopolyspora sp. ASAGF58 TaxID=2719023 RepID=UPI00143FD6FD|nr:histidine phosphatase family protein [Saccharopolyspora sp. ASAGF58]
MNREVTNSQHPDHPLAPGAETWTSYLQRAITGLQNILACHAGGTVLIVGHGETITAVAHHFLDLAASLRATAAFAANYASITRWEQTATLLDPPRNRMALDSTHPQRLHPPHQVASGNPCSAANSILKPCGEVTDRCRSETYPCRHPRRHPRRPLRRRTLLATLAALDLRGLARQAGSRTLPQRAEASERWPTAYSLAVSGGRRHGCPFGSRRGGAPRTGRTRHASSPPYWAA